MTRESESVGFLIKIIHDCIEKNANHNLKNFGLTLTQTRVLMFLRKRGELKTSQRDIEDYLKVSHPTVVGIIQRLESKGFIKCVTDPGDKRMKNICLTSKENEFLLEMERSKQEVERTLLKNFSEKETNQLKSMLKRAYNNIV